MTTSNFNKGVGKLTTDRFDFQSHVDGSSFRHKANQIDISPSITINGSDGYVTVQDAIGALATIAFPPVINDATSSVKGIIKLAGDISGTASSVTVAKIQGKPVSTSTPSSNQVLTWDGSSWAPATPSTFAASGDLSGNAVSQAVIGITGTAGTVSVSASTFTFASTSVPIFNQATRTSATGHDFNINAQSSSFVTGNGGNVNITGGLGGASGKDGGVSLSYSDGNDYALQLALVNGRVLSLFNSDPLQTSNMPANTGDMVMFIGDCVTAPTSGVPVNGNILYSHSGNLRVKQIDGNDFSIGSIPNPSTWGPTGAQTYSSRSRTQTTTTTFASAFTYSLPDETSVKFDVIMVGKEESTNKTLQISMSMGYVRRAGISADIGTVTTYDSRTNASWTTGTITRSTDTVTVKTGFNAATIINWFTVVQLTLVGD